MCLVFYKAPIGSVLEWQGKINSTRGTMGPHKLVMNRSGARLTNAYSNTLKVNLLNATCETASLTFVFADHLKVARHTLKRLWERRNGDNQKRRGPTSEKKRYSLPADVDTLTSQNGWDSMIYHNVSRSQRFKKLIFPEYQDSTPIPNNPKLFKSNQCFPKICLI